MFDTYLKPHRGRKLFRYLSVKNICFYQLSLESFSFDLKVKYVTSIKYYENLRLIYMFKLIELSKFNIFFSIYRYDENRNHVFLLATIFINLFMSDVGHLESYFMERNISHFILLKCPRQH